MNLRVRSTALKEGDLKLGKKIESVLKALRKVKDKALEGVGSHRSETCPIA